jgi:hypothetical protein
MPHTKWMASFSLTELLIGPDFYQVDILAWEGYLLEQSSVFSTLFLFSWSKSSNLCGCLLLENVVEEWVDCLPIRAKLFGLATRESATTECMPVVGSSLWRPWSLSDDEEIWVWNLWDSGGTRYRWVWLVDFDGAFLRQSQSDSFVNLLMNSWPRKQLWMVVIIGRCIPRGARMESSYLVDPASSHMLVSKIKPCMSKYKQIYTVKLRMAH